MIAQVKLIALASLLTVMVWSYADGVGETSERLTVRFVITEDVKWMVTCPAPATQIEFRGTNRAIRALRQEAIAGVLEIKLTPKELLGEGLEVREVKEIVCEDIVLRTHGRKLGVEVTDANPARLAFDIDEFVERSVPVEVTEIGSAVIEEYPPPVTVVAPSRIQLKFAKVLAPIGQKVDSAVRGDSTTVEVPVMLPVGVDGTHVQIKPLRVTVGFVVRDMRDEWVFEHVPVWVNTPARWRGGWDVIFKEETSLKSIKLEGPTDAIAQLKDPREENGISLNLDVRSDDRPPADQPRTRALRLNLPPKAWAAGVKLAEGETLPEVTFTVAKRETGG